MPARKQPPKSNGILTTAAEAIGTTLGSIAVKTGMVKPAPVKKSVKRSVKKSPQHSMAKAKRAPSKKTAPKGAVPKRAIPKTATP